MKRVKNKVHIFSIAFTACFFYISFSANSQEPLPDILQRGHISQWLICGPFPSDLNQGIKNAVKNNEAPLGTKDFWSGKGGITQLLPQPNEKIEIDGIPYSWLPFPVKSPCIDFSSLRPPDECIFFLSSYVQVPDDQVVYINLQTPLGARLWISKTQIRDVKSLPLEHTGIDRALVRLRKGLNLLILQVPFLSIQSISEITKIPIDTIPIRLWAQKEPTIGKTGYEISLHIRPIEQAGAIFYVPILEPSRKFTGPPLDPKQVFYLTIYNPTSQQIFPININSWLMPQNFALPSQQISLQPQEEQRIPLQIPNKGRKENDKTNVRVLITAPNEKGEDTTSEFTTQITFSEPEPISKTYLLSGTWSKPKSNQNIFDYFQQKAEDTKTQIWNAYENQDYGVDIGSANNWLSMLIQNPEMIVHTRGIMSQGKSTAQNIFAPIDERLLSIDTILMNILMGTKLKEAMWKEFNKSFIAWDYPYIAPQTCHILNKSNFKGIISNISPDTFPSLAYIREPFGTPLMIRTLQTPPPFRNFAEIKKWAYISHQEIENLIPEIDVLLLENTSQHLNTNILPELKNEIPPFYFYGNGSSEFFEEIHNYLNSRNKTESIPNIFQSLYSKEKITEVLSNTLLKTLLYQLEENLLLSQTTATIAGTLGMTYPDELIARLWIILLQSADPDVINTSLKNNEQTALLFQLASAISDTEKIIRQTMSHIAGNVNTLTHITDNKPNSQAIVVFNPNSTTKTLPIQVDISIPNTNFSLVTYDGKPIPCQFYTIKPENSSITQYQVEFVAEEVPSFGIKIFYLVPGNSPSSLIKTSDNFIENEFILLRVNSKTGNISQIIDKTTGKDIIPPEDNFDVIGFADIGKNSFKPFSKTPKKFETYKSDLLQKILIQFETAKGTLTKEYCIYQKIPRIYCYHYYSPQPNSTQEIITSALITSDDNTIPLYGSQSFAFTTFANNKDKHNNELFFAHRFFAKGQGDYIKKEDQLSIPITNVCFIEHEDENIYTLQNIIKKTLWIRGIPSCEIPMQEWLQNESKSSHLYIWTGTNKDYEKLMNLIKETSPTINNEIIRRGDVGTSFLVEITQNNIRQHIFGFLASDIEKLGSIINNFSNMLNQRGEFLIPSAVTNIHGKEIPEQGFAILFKGTKLISSNPNKLIYLHHGSINNQSSFVNSIPIHYQIVPFSGHWLKTNLIEQGNEKPFMSSTTGLHGGLWQNNTSFLSTNNPNIIISSIKPVGTGVPIIQAEPQKLADMFIAHLLSLSHQKQETLLDSSFNITSIQPLTPLESHETTSSNLKGQNVEFNPREIRTFAISLKKVTAPDRIPFDKKDIYHSNANLPLTLLPYTLESIVLKLTPINTSTTTNIQLTICNIDSNKTINGTVHLETSNNYILKTSQIPYTLPPLSTIQHTIPYEQVDKTNFNPPIHAWTEINGKTIHTFLLKEEFPAKIRYEKDSFQIKIIVENPLDIPLYGNIAWLAMQYSHDKHKIDFNKLIAPEHIEIFLNPHETNTYTFLPLYPTSSPVACITINNKTEFLSIQ